MIEKPFVEIEDVAELLDRTPGRVYQMIRAGELPACRVAGRLRIPRAAFFEWLEDANQRALAAVER